MARPLELDELTSTGTAFAISKIMSYVVASVLAVWTIIYGRHARRRGERAAARSAAGQSAAARAASPRPVPRRPDAARGAVRRPGIR